MSFLLPLLCYFFGKKGFVCIVKLNLQTFILNYKAVFLFAEQKKMFCDIQIDYLPSVCLKGDRHGRIKKAATLLKHQ